MSYTFRCNYFISTLLWSSRCNLDVHCRNTTSWPQIDSSENIYCNIVRWTDRFKRLIACMLWGGAFERHCTQQLSVYVATFISVRLKLPCNHVQTPALINLCIRYFLTIVQFQLNPRNIISQVRRLNTIQWQQNGRVCWSFSNHQEDVEVCNLRFSRRIWWPISPTQLV